MPDRPTRRTLLKSSLTAAAAATLPAAMAKEITVKDLSKGLAKPLTPANEKLTETALKNVNDNSAARLKHKLPENSEPSLMFQVRAGATQKW